MERSVVAFSSKSDYKDAFKEVLKTINSEKQTPKLIVFFAEAADMWYYAAEFKKNFPEAVSVGSSTQMTISSEGTKQKGLCALAVFSGIECACGALYEVDRHPRNYILHVKSAMSQLSSLENTCCLEFTNAFSKGEELVLDTFYVAFRDFNIPVIGGSSGNTDGSTRTIVALNGDIFVNTCVFVLIKNLNGKVVIHKEHVFKPSKKIFTVTDVDCEDRIVYEYDHKNPAEVLSNALHVSMDGLPNVLSAHPMGRVMGDDILVSEFENINYDGSISYFSQIYNYTKLVLMDQDNLEEVWERSDSQIKSKITSCSFAIIVNCKSRTDMFIHDNVLDKFVSNLKINLPNFICLSGFGEQYNRDNLNQTMVVLMFE